MRKARRGATRRGGRRKSGAAAVTRAPRARRRLDLPDSDVDAMFASLVQLRELPEALKVYPGHGYAGESTTVGAEKKAGLLSPFSKEQFKKMFAR